MASVFVANLGRFYKLNIKMSRKVHVYRSSRAAFLPVKQVLPVGMSLTGGWCK